LPIASCVLLICQALSCLGLIGWIGRQTEAIVLAVNEESQLAVAILLILWVSAIASAFVDNIPLTTMMIRIVLNLNKELALPLQPLVWALAFGACLGGWFVFDATAPLPLGQGLFFHEVSISHTTTHYSR
jgi:Na+/H+ antiporter NhaD/arsenite permease-like protein